jgi:hypothetical protein
LYQIQRGLGTNHHKTLSGIETTNGNVTEDIAPSTNHHKTLSGIETKLSDCFLLAIFALATTKPFQGLKPNHRLMP